MKPICIKFFESAVLALCMLFGCYHSQGIAETSKPNIILIFVDDMAYGDPSCYGGTLVRTPHIDSLAEKGIRFQQGYTISPVCGPSRVGLLTGLQPSRIGVYWNPDMGAVKMPEGHKVISEALKMSGYTTGLVGKWNLNDPSWDPMPAANYFDYTYDVMVWEGDYWPDENGNYRGVNDRNYGSSKKSGQWGPIKEGDEYLTDRLSRHACEFISQEKDKPFFLMLSYNAPHSPLQGKQEHLERLNHVKSEALKHYASMIISIDEGIGKVIKTLEKADIRDKSVLVFVSDNGPALTRFKGIPKDWPRGEMLGSTNGLRGHKGTFWEGGIRVPYIISGPFLNSHNSVIDTPVTTLDLYPTFCALAGLNDNLDVKLDGSSLLPILNNENSSLEERKIMWFSGSSGAVRQSSWKLVFSPKDGEQLYNLCNDPYETVDLSLSKPKITQDLLKIISHWRGSIPPPITPRKTL